MTSKVRLQPSCREFEVHEHESVLDAALRAGLSPRYSCANGSCGECKARLISGSVMDCNHHDYVFTESEKAAGHVLMCSVTPTADLVELEAAASSGVDDIPLQRIDTTVARLERLDDATLVMHLKTPRSRTLRFFAGQHVKLNINGQPSRNKSIASCPCNARQLRFHLRRNPGDAFTTYVFDSMQTGETVTVEGPQGSFVLDEDSRRPLVLLAHETGFAPLQSIIEHAIALELAQPMHLYWVVDRPGGHYLHNQVRAWVDALDNFRYTPLVNEPGAAGAALDTAGAAVVRDYPDLSQHDVYLSGSDTANGTAGELLMRHGLDPARLFVDALERF
jgi:CDP-4-dehydro-6-deoxyglucose reductase